MKQTYYSHGKLLLTGEYFVLDGAQALAAPCILGQSLSVQSTNNTGIDWSSYDMDGNLWFQHHYAIESIKHIPQNNINPITNTLQKILHHAYLQKPSFFKNLAVECKTKLEFPRDWGLGSSSTLINNIAQWVGIDAYVLLENSFGGSGYDIAAAQSEKPFLYERYKLPKAVEIDLDWEFTDQIFFIHRNQKQDSKEGIALYRAKTSNHKKDLSRLSSLTQDFLNAKNIDELEQAIASHEQFIATTIGLKPIKEKLFPDYPHAIKSLGAWGGDFFMALGDKENMQYFKDKGYHTIVSYSDMVL